ncbi:MAG: tRNA uridine-5-carboxymethylaminomethyl(34) synthesis GTPase MnmE [Ruminococcaceae bacterium]|nr:tRNA uridine-5-carboxymethylaminomethyl(34) synthesis GTPase MnmE [Oscillospiraceae bacterium]
MNPLHTTISAISTPRGKGGIATIRVSGPDALKIAERMFTPKSNKPLTEYAPRSAVFGSILDSDGNICDEGICVTFAAPSSFTGENMAEISCHGGLAVTEAVYLSTLAHGASSAGPGEFTRRAFINGKLSLTEAEAVGQLIDADTKERMILSGGAVRGNVSRKIKELCDGMLDTMTALYAAIDYPEEDVGDEGERQIADTIRRTRDGVKKLLDTYKTGRAISGGVKCAICGRPNVGKSSIFNLIVGDESAIVTSIAGTTRDILRETVSFGGITLRLSDTAGIRESDDTVEKMGIDRAESEVSSAELVIAVFDGSESLTDEDCRIISLLKANGGNSSRIAVINKSDKGFALTSDEESEIASAADKVIKLSANSGEIAQLSSAVAEIYGSDSVNLAGDAIIWDARQREILSHALISLEAALGGIEYGDPIDCVCTSAEEALAALSETDGRGIEEVIVDEIFRRFCVGK